MKRSIAGAVAVLALGLGGCVAVPAPHGSYGSYGAYPGYSGEAYYYPAPAVGVGIYAPPVYYYGHRHRGHRHWR